MKLDCVVIADNTRRLDWLFRFHSKLFKVKSRSRFKLILEDGMEVYYMTWGQFESWKLGRTYIHFADYIMANDDCFQHSGHCISKTELRDLALKERENILDETVDGPGKDGNVKEGDENDRETSENSK